MTWSAYRTFSSHWFSLLDTDPNPYPSPGAVSETFVVTGDSTTSTTVIPIPTASTTIIANGQYIFLAPGGTPVSALLPSGVSELNAITPTWSSNIIPPTAGPIIFTAPISGSETFSTVIPSPSNGVLTTVTGPNGEVWSLSGGTNGPSIVGTLPTDIGILSGTTPSAVMPTDWLGPWTNPASPLSTKTGQPVQSNTFITWNPNPVPPSGAVSETFVCSGTTTSFPLPTDTTTISAGGATITLDRGGIPIFELLDPGCSEVGGIVPTWSLDIIPPPSASIITFTGPLTSTPTWISTVPVPSRSDSPGNRVNGPPGDKNRCNSDNFWSLLFHLVIDPCLPLDVGIVGGVTPVPTKPPGWKGPWTDPIPRPTPPPTSDGSATGTNTMSSQSTSQSSSSSSSSPSSCPTAPADLTLSDEDDTADWDDNGTDPDQRRRAVQINSRSDRYNPRYPGNIKVCGETVTNTDAVLLGSGSYPRLDPNGPANSLALVSIEVDGPPQMGQAVNRALGYINQFVTQSLTNYVDCNWVLANLINYELAADGSRMGLALVQAIDMVRAISWVDKPLNQAKSNVVNQNSATTDNPPQKANIDKINESSYLDSNLHCLNGFIRFFLRNLGALGQYFSGTSQIFLETALRVQTLLSVITPDRVPKDDGSLPLLFNQWLTNLINTYPNGCTYWECRTNQLRSRWNYYRTTMQSMAAQTGQPIPNCFPLINGGVYNPSTFNAALLLPTAPRSPRCNVPGTAGVVTYTLPSPSGSIGTLKFGTNVQVKMMGAGNTDYYAMGSGASIAWNHIQGQAIDGTKYDGCTGAYLFNDVTANTAGWATANVAFTCGTATGAQDVDITFVMGGQQLSSCILVRHSTNMQWVPLCTPTSATLSKCAGNYVLLGGPTRRQAPPLQPLTMAIAKLGFSVQNGI
ncbi:hypothetical protein C8R45DRAFT_842971 [Mycena sanguinolenta]|nr:hypothetical protein C8R45DRAFT_842971 [Mycena sanguinolenta]